MSGRKRHPLSKRLTISAGFCLVAYGSTDVVASLPGHPVSYWIIPAAMWAVAIVVTMAAFRNTQPRWAFPLVAFSYGIAAMASSYFVLASGSYRLELWALPVLMWMMTAIFTLGALRANARMLRQVQMPTGAVTH